MSKLIDLILEKTVLSGIIKYGPDGISEVDDVISSDFFSNVSNQKLYLVLHSLVYKEKCKTIDIPTILVTANALGLKGLSDEYLLDLSKQSVDLNNLRKHAFGLKRLNLARELMDRLEEAQIELAKCSSDSKISAITGIIEDKLFGSIVSSDSEIATIGLLEGAKEYLDNAKLNTKDIVGIPTGFQRYDHAIGGGLRRGTINIIGARPKTGKCISSYLTVVYSNQGMLMPYELFDCKNDAQKSCGDLSLLSEKGDLQRPDYWWNNGYSDVLDIETKYGNTLTATPNHPIKVLDENGQIKWKNCEDLQMNDYIVLRRGDNCFGKKQVDLNYAYSIGLLVGDGHIRKGALDLANIDIECRNVFELFIKSIGGYISTNANTRLVCCQSKIIKPIVELEFYDQQKLKIIPKLIRQCNKEVICSCLQGYFDADGTVERSGVTCTTNSVKLSIQLKAILLNLGILTNTRKRYIKIPNRPYRGLYYEISISNCASAKMFQKLIGFRIRRKQKALNEFCKRNESTKNDTIPNLSVPLQKFKKAIQNIRGYFLEGHINSLRDIVNRWIRKERNVRRDILYRLLNKLQEFSCLPEYQYLEKISDKHLLFDPIKNMNGSTVWTCDFYIPKDHSFITNGIISHNSFLCLNMIRNAVSAGIPTLYLDTELTHQQHQMPRMLSLLSGVDRHDIETGKFGNDMTKNQLVYEAGALDLPFQYKSVGRQRLSSIMSMIRRWLVKHVGFQPDGTANTCLLVYDFIKPNNSDDTGSFNARHEKLGDMVNNLSDMLKKYQIPCLMMSQVNRLAIEKPGQGTAAGSDQLEVFCESYSILGDKTQEDFGQDGFENGSLKLTLVYTRSGPGLQKGNYINIKKDLSTSKIEEGELFSEVTEPFE